MSFPLDAEFTVIMYFHDDCLACLDAADEAVTMAKVTGSTGAKVERATAVATDRSAMNTRVDHYAIVQRTNLHELGATP